jgi:hypothetical protein
MKRITCGKKMPSMLTTDFTHLDNFICN